MFLALLLSLAAAPLHAEPTPRTVDSTPRIVDPAGEGSDRATGFMSDDELARLAETDIQGARAILRRSARSNPAPASRALALRLLATHDASTATARICARSLRIDIDAVVRRGAAECLGRMEPDVGGAHTPALVAALDDGSLDVITMAGWALANVGDAPAIGDVAKRGAHTDPRIAKLFLGYAERMRERLGLVYQANIDEEVRDAAGNRLAPSGYALVSQAHGLDVAAGTGWLGLYGGVMGWYHGAFLPSAHGGRVGAEAAWFGGLGGAAIGAAAGTVYGFTRADSLPLAHTVVQLGTVGAFAGFGAGLLSGVPPTSGVASANLSLAGTLAGTAAGIALVETKPPTLGALGVGLVSGLSFGTAAGALFRGYGALDQPSIGAALLIGGTASAVGTMATADLDIGLFPLAGSTVGAMAGAGVGSVCALIAEPNGFTEATGWTIAATTLTGAGAGAVVGLLVPRHLDPLLNHELELFPPAVGAVATSTGAVVPALVLAGRF
jgi:hypothetical protein